MDFGRYTDRDTLEKDSTGKRQRQRERERHHDISKMGSSDRDRRSDRDRDTKSEMERAETDMKKGGTDTMIGPVSIETELEDQRTY